MLDWAPISTGIAKRAGDIKASLRRIGVTRSTTDMLVAATAIEFGFEIATDNRKDFQIQGLTLSPLP
jgi:predicted nucleic acid-binding protein